MTENTGRNKAKQGGFGCKGAYELRVQHESFPQDLSSDTLRNENESPAELTKK